MPSIRHIRRLSCWLYSGATTMIVALPILMALVAYRYWADPLLLAQAFSDLPPETAFTPAKGLLVAGVSAITLIPAVLLLIQMRGLFRRYSAGEILTAPCAIHIRRIGQMLVALGAIRLAVPTLHGFALTFDNPPGTRALSIALSSDAFAFALAGGLLVVIGWAMAEAARAVEENAGFI